MFRTVLLGLLVALAALTLDQYTKWMALSYLFGSGFGIPDFLTWMFNLHDLYPQTGVEITSFFNVVMVWNFGVSFGFLNTGTDVYSTILIAVSLVICFILLIWLWNSRTFSKTILLGLIIGGALGNAADRFRFGGVIDFLDIHFYGYHWPAFNLADAFITTSVILLVLPQIFSKDTRDDTYI